MKIWLILVLQLMIGYSSIACSFENIKHLEKGKTSPPSKIEQVAWIAGTWRGEAFGGQTEEIWSSPQAGTMMASFRLVVKDKVQFYEIEIIREVENTIILELKHFSSDLKGWEKKDEKVSFPLVKISEDAAFFDGMTFRKKGNDQLEVFVNIKGKEVLFSYRRHAQ